jgi:hypothetical protein
MIQFLNTFQVPNFILSCLIQDELTDKLLLYRFMDENVILFFLHKISCSLRVFFN